MITTEPAILRVYKRLNLRLKDDHPAKEFIMNQIGKISSGHGGELEVGKFISMLELPKSSRIFHELHIPLSNNRFLQIDCLVITPNFILLIEVKNIRGAISFEKNPSQLIRELEGKREAFRCPEQQVIRHERRLRSFLSTFYTGELPSIFPLIVMAYPRTIIVKGPVNVPVVNACDIENYVDKLPIETILSDADLSFISNTIDQKRAPFAIQPLSHRFAISINDLRLGIICSECYTQITGSEKRCKMCGFYTMQSKIDSVMDFMILGKNPLTNADIREYLDISRHGIVSYIMSHANFRTTGIGKGTQYHLH